MKVLWIGGSHRRHLYYANTIAQHFDLAGAIIVNREEIIPTPPKNIDPHDTKNFIRHFEERAQAEVKYFGDQSMPDCEIHKVEPEELNTPASVKFIKKINPDIVVIFGSGLVKEPLYSALPRETINMHLGLSPRYRGAATLFWPFYFLEPAYAGSTFHYIVAEPDAGLIIHQVVPELVSSDGIHDVGAKTVVASTQALLELLKLHQEKGKWNAYPQKATGKNFLQKDFRPEHLRVIYDLYDNKLVQEYLAGTLTKKAPKLIRQF